MEYTLGAWTAKPMSQDERGIIINGEDGGIICRVAIVGGTLPEVTANAQLISSAPDMYEALKDIQKYVLSIDACGPETTQVIAGKCYVALAKIDDNR